MASSSTMLWFIILLLPSAIIAVGAMNGIQKSDFLGTWTKVKSTGMVPYLQARGFTTKLAQELDEQPYVQTWQPIDEGYEVWKVKTLKNDGNHRELVYYLGEWHEAYEVGKSVLFGGRRGSGGTSHQHGDKKKCFSRAILPDGSRCTPAEEGDEIKQHGMGQMIRTTSWEKDEIRGWMHITKSESFFGHEETKRYIEDGMMHCERILVQKANMDENGLVLATQVFSKVSSDPSS